MAKVHPLSLEGNLSISRLAPAQFRQHHVQSLRHDVDEKYQAVSLYIQHRHERVYMYVVVCDTEILLCQVVN